MNGKRQSSPRPRKRAMKQAHLRPPHRGRGRSGRESDPAFPLPLPSPRPHPPPNAGNCGEGGKACASSCGLRKVNDSQGPAKERAAGRVGDAPGPAPHQPSTQSREGSPLESSSCPCRTEGRVPTTAARRLPAAAFRWKLVTPRPRAAPPAAAAISAARGLTGARGRREESSPFRSTNGRAACETRYPMGDGVLCTSRAEGAGEVLRRPVASRQVSAAGLQRAGGRGVPPRRGPRELRRGR